MMLSVSGDESDPSCSSSASKLPLNDKNKYIVRPPNTTSLRSLAELLTFKSLIPSSTTNANHQNLLPHDDAPAAPGRVSLSSSSSSLSIVINNNEDLLIQILLFLPPKSLIRFQCVSKQWLSLISSPRFCRLHSQKNPTSSSTTAEAGLFLYRRIYENPELNSISLPHEGSTAMGMITSRFINFLNADGKILGFHCCNGLIFIDFYWNYEIRRYYVYNPTTNQYRLIPQPIDGKSHKVKAVNVVFDPLKSDEYRLVCVLSKLTDEKVEMEEFDFLVYSSQTGVWKECTDIKIEGTDHYHHFKQGVYWNGNLYWTNAIRSLLCFDLERDCVRKMNTTMTDESLQPLPHNLIVFYFGESGGNLHLIERLEPQTSFLYIRELELDLGLGRYHSRWLLKYRVDIGLFTARYPLLMDERFATFVNQFVFGIPCFLVDKKENKAKIMISLRGKIIFYEINSGSIEELVEIEPADLQFLGYYMSFYSWNDAFKHFETLACV